MKIVKQIEQKKWNHFFYCYAYNLMNTYIFFVIGLIKFIIILLTNEIIVFRIYL